MKLHFDQIPELYNYVEVGLWPALGVLSAVYGLRNKGVVRRDAFIATGVLFVFGASDWFEANTGNEWWHPWWLFLWKAICVLALFLLVVRAYRRSKAKVSTANPETARYADSTPPGPPAAI